MKLSDDQIEELREIFKDEALSHIKAIGKILIRLTEGDTEDAIEPLGQAYREAHGLKGSAGTLGVTRIAVIGEKLEDVLKFITEKHLTLEFEDIELLLDALDAVRKALDDLSSNLEELTDNESKCVQKLESFIYNRSDVPDTEPADEPDKSKAPSAEAGSDADGINTTEGPEEGKAPDKQAPPKRTSLIDDLVSTAPGGPATVKEEVSAPKRELDIPSDQMSYLMSVFRTEASEHIKSLAEMLFNLEEGRGDVQQTLVKAFREAHSLKGSSGTIGFERVATVTHALEDVLGALQKSPGNTTADVVDVLLDTIDVIRRSVKEGVIGDASLSPKETKSVDTLKALVIKLKESESAETPAIDPSAPDGPDVVAPTPRDTRASSGAAPTPDRPSANDFQTRETFIRVSEEAIGNLIAQVGELFEAHLYLMNATTGLRQLEENATDMLKLVGLWRQRNAEMEGDNLEAENIYERMKGFKTQLTTIEKSFTRDERQFSKLIQNSQEALRHIRLAPVSTIFVMIRRQVREICRLTNKRVELFLDGGEYAVDRKVLEAIEDPLIHILRNAVDHGIETGEIRKQKGKSEKGRISVVARHVGDAVELAVSDDGQGIDPDKVRKSLKKRKLMGEAEIDAMTKDEIFDCLFESGISTQSDVSKISGRGVGLDVVKYTMERLGGEVRLDSKPGKGSVFNLRLPLSMSTLRCLLFRVSGRIMAIPASNIEKVILQEGGKEKHVGGGEVITYNGKNIPLGSLSELLRLSTTAKPEETQNRIVVMISFGERRFAFYVDDIIEYAQVILRPLGDLLERVSYISGISLLGTGELALVLNPSDLVRASGSSYVKRSREFTSDKEDGKSQTRILVVDDSMATRTLEKSMLESAGYTVETASDGYKALDVLNANKVDLVITDIQMPNMNGLDLTRTIKTQYRFLQLPVILVSSLGSDEDKARGLEIGADAYIVKKELSQRELIETIEQLL